nr:NAD(+)/NADH kinase [Candidatus Freyrarchaeum guaymaensis]
MVLVGFVVRWGSEGAASTTQRIMDFLRSEGHEAVVIKSPSDIVEGMSFIVSNGGDGTVISTARMVVSRGVDVPIFPVNSGRLGFLTSVDASEAVPEVKKILEGYFYAESFNVLDAFVDGELVGFAVNEVVLSGEQGKLMNCMLSLDGVCIANVRSDKV